MSSHLRKPRLQLPYIALGLLSALILGGLLWWQGQPWDIVLTASVTLLTAFYWVTEALPIPATSLIPFAAFPLTGVLSYTDAASALGNHVIILLMGAFMLSKAIEHSGAHGRLAYYMIRLTGGSSPKRIVLGFMLTSALLSMWISNTATTLMLLPMAIAVLRYSDDAALSAALLLGIAYAASLGGVGTPVGTPPNIIFISIYKETHGLDMSFIEWMAFGLPVVLVGIPLMALWLTRGLHGQSRLVLPEPGPWQSIERRTLMVFGLVVLAWISRPYWTQWLHLTTVGDSTIALAGVVAMFVVPAGNGTDEQGRRNKLLDWQTASDIPWGMLLLFAGGICIAKAFTESGLSELMGQWLSGLAHLPLPVLILVLCLSVTFLTEITSNTATATLLMPVLASAGVAAGVEPKLLMIPAALSASCAFMLPVATAPNAIIYSSQKVSIQQMARQGLMLNIVIALVITAVVVLVLA